MGAINPLLPIAVKKTSAGEEAFISCSHMV